MTTLNRKISIAPMMDWTDRHCRYFHRLLTPHALLYTEMVTTGALIYGDVERHLQYNKEEHPVALQLGGSNPEALAQCAKLGEEYKYDEINLNVGCPSDRVQNGAFGACLMREAGLVADCLKAMQDAVDIPVTIKTRLGIDELDSYEFTKEFVQTVYEKSGCNVFIMHARKAWLQGLSPKENREVPPLMWERVWQLKKDFPHLKIIINGGLQTLDHLKENDAHVDGFMIGREAYYNPYALAEFENHFFKTSKIDRTDVLEKMLSYIEREIQNDIKVRSIARHVLNLYKGQSGGKIFRQILGGDDINYIEMKELRQRLDTFLNADHLSKRVA